MSKPIIEVRGLSKKYRLGAIGATSLREELGRMWARLKGADDRDAKEFWALRDVSFTVDPGEVVGIIGQNGAGKSTLLKILSRITEPTDGTALLRGRVASLLEVGTGFHPELTGRENIFMNGAILGMTRTEVKRKFSEIAAFAEVEQFIDTPVKRYSSGMYVRLAFSVAAHLEPEILIIDEVLAVGDAAFQRKCLGKMEGVAASGRTVLFVSHNMAAVRSLCHRAVLLSHGTLTLSGPAKTVTDAHLSEAGAQAGLLFEFGGAERTGALGSQLRIDALRINDGNGLWHGRPLVIDMTFTCVADVHDVAFGVGFCDRVGTRILSIDSDVSGHRWDLRRGASGRVRFAIPSLLLEPDQYLLDVGARSGDTFGLDNLPQVARVTVAPSDATPAVIAMRASGRGGVRLPANWQLEVL